MIKLVGENDEVVVFADVGQFEIARLALDVQVAFVPIVETIGQGEAIALIDTPTHTYLGTDMGQILTIMHCATSV